jgi:murein DD-endopeptidase MepM/ murein hydrolase activator NlpD
MVTIDASVGLSGVNRPGDVKKVQILLNQNRHLSDHPEIAEDSICGPKTVWAIRNFQKKVVGMNNPDGRVDPGGKTITALNTGAISGDRPIQPPPAPSPVTPTPAPPGQGLGGVTLGFPLRRRPSISYKTGGRYFGAPRSDGRLHAGCDLIAPAGTEIFAVADGVLGASYPFYSGTDALEVVHTGGFVVRYGEISGLASGLRRGSNVTRGQLIAYVGRLASGSSMLHFEMYSGTGSGGLTVRSNQPYQRRSDLIDPTIHLDQASLP